MVLQLSKIYWACSISNSEIKMVMNFGNRSNNSENTLHNKMERSKTEVCSESDRLSVDDDRCSSISTTDSITDNSESGPDTNTSLKFGIANILRSNEHSVSAPNSIKFPTFASDELSTISRNSLAHLNTSRLVFNPYFVQNSPILWPVKDISRDRQILTRRVGHPYQNRTPPKKKKPRTSFSRLTIIELEKRFEQQKYLASSERSHLAKTLRISDSQVKTWFQNRRTKWRRQVAEEKEIQRQAANRIFMSIGQSVIQP